MRRTRYPMAGVIASSGFASGDRLVVGSWAASPIGPFTDVMWTSPDGTRTLLSPSPAAEEFITAIYSFDRTKVVEVAADASGTRVEVAAGPVRMVVEAGRPWLVIPPWRPAWFTRWVEDRVARAAMGVRTFGSSPTGVFEWYRADVYRPAHDARATIDGEPLGAMGSLHPQVGVGFTDPPRRPSIVTVRPLLEDPSGRLDEIVSRRR